MKVKIRMLRATGMGLVGVAVPGDVVEVDQALAQQLVGNGRAEHVKGKLYEAMPEEEEEPKIEAATVEPAETAAAEPQRRGSEPRRRQP
jgi:hypothetical protein